MFAYSKEDGTPAAWLPMHVRKADKIKRVRALGKICTEVTREFNKSIVGKKIKVLYEDVDFDKNMFVGRAEFHTPEVDGLVYFTGAQADVGKFYEVEITKSDNYDLYGKCTEVHNEDEFTE